MSGTKIANARAAAKALIDLIEFNSSVGVISFASSISTVQSITKVEDQASKDAIKLAIDSISAGGGTSIGLAAQQALNQLLDPSVPDGTKVVFLLSDGISGDNALAPIPQYQAAQIPIFTFSYGSDADIPTLQTMATSTGGQFFVSPIALSAITQAFQTANTVAAGGSGIASGEGSASPSTVTMETIFVDSTLGVFSLVVAFEGAETEASVMLSDPSGTDFSPEQITQSGGETLVQFRVPNPTAGEWTIAIAASSMNVSFSYQASGTPAGATFNAFPDTFDGKRTVTYPDPFIVTVNVELDLPVLNAEGFVDVTAPDGSMITLPMNDDGSDQDFQADDGLYTAGVNYDQSGVYDLRVRVVAAQGVAMQSGNNLEPSAGINGEFVAFPPPQPIPERFERTQFFQVDVSDVVPDDHGNTFATATPVPADNSALIPGRIEMVGDIDVFEIAVPSGVDEIFVRVSNLAFGMDPALSVINGTSMELLEEGSLSTSATADGYLAINLMASGLTTIFAQVTHATDGTGWYQVSAGSAIFREAEVQVPVPTSSPTSTTSTSTIPIRELTGLFWLGVSAVSLGIVAYVAAIGSGGE